MPRITKVNGNFSEQYLEWRKLKNDLESYGGDPYGVIVALKDMLESKAWAKLSDRKGKPFSSFSAFVRDPDKGLGMATDELLKLIDVQGETERRAIVGKDDLLIQLFTDARRLVRGAVKGEIPAAGNVGRPKDNVSGTHNTQVKRDADSVLARLKRDHPDMAKQVIAGTMTANAAARQLGWRKPRVLLTTPQQVAHKLREHYTTGELKTLIEELNSAIVERNSLDR